MKKTILSITIFGAVLFLSNCSSSTTTHVSPTQVSLVAAGTNHTCGIINGQVKCWGLNTNGQLGNFTNTTSNTPVAVKNLPARAVGIAASTAHSCAIFQGGVQCWGNDAAGVGQLGDGAATARNYPSSTTTLSAGATPVSISSGTDFTCGLTSVFAAGGAQTQTLNCWGLGTSGQLGNGGASITTASTALYTQASANSAPSIASYCTGDQHACAVVNGGLQCWGANGSGQLGNGTTAASTVPVQVLGMGPGSDVSAVACGKDHTCAVVAGSLQCWGSNVAGQLGDGTTTSNTQPVVVQGAPTVMSISAGNQTTCIVNKLGSAYCWGNNSNGQVGDGTTTNRSTPTAVSTLGSGTTQISTGLGGHTCAVMNGAIYCWGLNTNGQLGVGDTTNHSSSGLVSF